MNDFFKYLTAGEEDQSWGLYLNVAGVYWANPEKSYPPMKHPSGYYFSWQSGRILQEYQLLYITKGSGTFETHDEKFPIRAGAVVLIQPGIWHRYKPNFKSGWQEHYIGFNGELASRLLKHPLFNRNQPVLNVGVREELIDTYYKIFDLVNDEKPGFQQITSGLIVKMLGQLISIEKQKEFTGKRIETIIEDARFKIREQVALQLDMKKLAREYNIGYSYFRKMFKNYTGMSPHKYHLELKVMRAKELLLVTDKSVKEISYDLGFQSIHYFSRLFKNKVGKSPTEFRG
ncbi:AraC family transcriptional regulator [Sunxiuqinia sp. sy24]|uniref:AraC family transcriptional regulator n=1 Tax=Sunxiuqinia sp. sy24 TaxID=3461495 RepID=UPI004045290A